MSHLAAKKGRNEPSKKYVMGGGTHRSNCKEATPKKKMKIRVGKSAAGRLGRREARRGVSPKGYQAKKKGKIGSYSCKEKIERGGVMEWQSGSEVGIA